MKIAIVGAKRPIHEQYCTHWTGLRSALERMPLEYNMFCCRYSPTYVEALLEYKPDVVIYNLLDMAKNIEHRIRIRNGLPNAKIVFWYGDARTPETGQIKVDLSGTVDLFLVSNNGIKDFQREAFGLEPHFMPLAAEPIPHPIIEQKSSFDFLFIGGKYNNSGFQERFKIIDNLEQEHGLTVINGFTPEQKAKVYQAMPKLYSSAKFTLDISHFWDIHKYTSNRYWVIPANWGFALTKRFPGCEELYPENTRVYWDTVEELVDKMNYYRKYEEERKKMIYKGWKHTVDNHTYKNRIEAILDML